MKIVPAGATVSTGEEVGSKRGAQCVPGQSSVGPIDVVTLCGSNRLHMPSASPVIYCWFLHCWHQKELGKWSLDERGIKCTAGCTCGTAYNRKLVGSAAQGQIQSHRHDESFAPGLDYLLA